MQSAQRVGFADKSRAASTACGRRPRPENPLPFSNKITTGEITKICKGFSGLERGTAKIIWLLSQNKFELGRKIAPSKDLSNGSLESFFNGAFTTTLPNSAPPNQPLPTYTPSTRLICLQPHLAQSPYIGSQAS